MRRSSPEHRTREARQRRLVRDRDVLPGEPPRCLLERKTARGWVPCGRYANQTAHILRRNQCGEFWDALEVAVLACDDCHPVLDHNYLGDAPFEVRVPFEYAAQAWLYLLDKFDSGELKAKPYQRYNPFGSPLYADVVRPHLGAA